MSSWSQSLLKKKGVMHTSREPGVSVVTVVSFLCVLRQHDKVLGPKRGIEREQS